MAEEYVWTPPEQKRINDSIEEAIACHTRIEAEKDMIKEIAETMKENLGMKPAQFNALVNERFKNKSTKEIEKHEDIIALNETIQNNAKSAALNNDDEEEND